MPVLVRVHSVCFRCALIPFAILDFATCRELQLNFLEATVHARTLAGPREAISPEYELGFDLGKNTSS
jgi:hypothetical protein